MRHKLLTDLDVRQMKPDPSRRVEIADTKCYGLHLVVCPSGHRSFVMRFRRPRGTGSDGYGAICKLTIGRYAPPDSRSPLRPLIGQPHTLEQARTQGYAIQHRRGLGEDVYLVEQRRKRTGRPSDDQEGGYSFRRACEDYVEKHLRASAPASWRKGAQQIGLQYPQDGGPPTLIEGRPASKWQDLGVKEIKKADVRALIDSMSETPAMAHVVHVSLFRAFDWLLRKMDLIDVHPMQTLDAPTYVVAKKRRVLTRHEIALFWGATEGEVPALRDAGRLLLLTAQRRNEVCGMRWDELSVDLTTWTIPRDRMKTGDERREPNQVPMSRMAADILSDIKRVGRSPFVLTVTGSVPVDVGSTYKARIDSRMPGVPAWSNHDLRRTARTIMTDEGVSRAVAEACLDHAVPGLTAVYELSEYRAQKRAAMEKLAAYVAVAIGEKK